MNCTAMEGQTTFSTLDCVSQLDDNELPYVMKKTFLCDECGRSFTNKTILDVHLNAHKFTDHKSLVKCDICDELFPTKASLARHVKRSHQKQFRCEKCGKCFGKKYNLDGHKLIHEGIEPYKCGTCGEEFAYKSLLNYHMKNHTGEKPFECNVCGQSFKLKGILKNHMTLHSNEKKFKCVICSKTFRCSGYLVDHIKTHNKLMPYSCKTCNKSFSSKKTLRSHMARHIENTIYKCEFCLQGFEFQARFVLHKECHIAENEWKCLDCGEIFSSKTLLTCHKKQIHITPDKIHKTEREGDFICHLCGHDCKSRYSLNRHRMTHIAKDRWKCRICDDIFSSKALLSAHRRRSHPGQISHKCEFCDTTFTKKGNLDTHKKCHIGLNKWKCQICEQIFLNFDLLQLHRRANHYRMDINRPFKCELCDKSFTTKGNLTQHNKVHIANNSWKCLTCSCLFPDSESLKTHRRSCSKAYPKCSFCDATFKNSQSLVHHKEIHIADNVWICLGCNERFTDRIQLITHGEKCQKLKSVSHQNKWCRFCEKVFDIRSNFNKHDNTHVGVNIWKCLTCDQLFSDKKSLRNHKRNTHSNTHKAVSDNQASSNILDTNTEKKLECKIIHGQKRKKASNVVVSDKQKDLTLLNLSKKSQMEEQEVEKDKVILKDQGHTDESNQQTKSNQRCKTCGFKVAKGYQMSSHRLLHHVNRKLAYVCVHCGKCFTTKRALKLHSATCKCKNALNLKCTRCHLVFKNRLDLIHHKGTHANSLHYRCKNVRKKLFYKTLANKSKEKKPFKCQICRAKFSCKTFLTYHSKIHYYKYSCDLCSSIFKSIYSLAAHINTHKLKKQRKCPYCFKLLFKHKFCFKSHMKGHCRIKLKHICKLCRARFENKHDLTKHMGTNKFACKFCHKTFHVKGSFTGHKTVHISESRWKCKECKKIFQDQRALIIHSNINHGILGKRKRNTWQNQCNINCRLKNKQNKMPHKDYIGIKRDASKNEFENNRKQIPQENYVEINRDPSKTAYCIECGIEFNFMISLQIHNRRWHSKFSCYHCKLNFTGHVSYRCHMTTHTFGCGICKMLIKKYWEFEKHLEVHEVHHKCKFCGEMFHDIDCYRRHILAHKECDVICEYCSVRCKGMIELERHICDTHARIYHVQNLYYCNHCGQSFDTFSECQNHSKTHQDSNQCLHFKTKFYSYTEWKDTVFRFACKQKHIFCGSCGEWINLEGAKDYCLLIEKSLRPHVCMKCKGYFLQKKRATEHLFLYHGELNDGSQTVVADTFHSDCGPSKDKINIIKETLKLKPPQKNKGSRTKQRNCNTSIGRNGSKLNESVRKPRAIKPKATGVTKQFFIPQRNEGSPVQPMYCSINTGSKSMNVNNAAVINNTFQSTIAITNNLDLNGYINASVNGVDNSTKSTSTCIADELFRKTNNFQRILVNPSYTRLNEYLGAQKSHTNNYSESNTNGLDNVAPTAVKSESDVDTYFNLDSSSSLISSQTNNHTFQLIRIKSEPIAAYDIDDIKPDIPFDIEEVGTSVDVKQENLTPFIQMVNDGRYTEEKIEF